MCLNQSPKSGHGSQNENVAQQKVETMGENDAASNQSSGCMACSQRNKDCVEKGRDAQVEFLVLYLELSCRLEKKI